MTNKLQTKNYNFLRRGASFCGHFAVLFGCWVRGGNRRLSQTCLFALLLGFEVVLVAGTSAVDELLAGLCIHVVGVAIEQGETATGFLGLMTVLRNSELTGIRQGFGHRGLLRLLHDYIRGSCTNSGCQEQNSREYYKTEAISKAHFESVEWMMSEWFRLARILWLKYYPSELIYSRTTILTQLGFCPPFCLFLCTSFIGAPACLSNWFVAACKSRRCLSDVYIHVHIHITWHWQLSQKLSRPNLQLQFNAPTQVNHNAGHKIIFQVASVSVWQF